MKLFALAHVRAAADCAVVLRPFRVYAPAELEKARGIPLGRVSYDEVEEVCDAFVLKHRRDG